MFVWSVGLILHGLTWTYYWEVPTTIHYQEFRAPFSCTYIILCIARKISMGITVQNDLHEL